jgi:phosphonate transport system ATP-binding protein
VARALFQEPVALIADEPVSAVDPARARSLLELLCRISDEEGLTLVVSMHQVELAREFFPRLVGLKEGRVSFDQSTADVEAADLDRLFRLDGEGGGP